MWHSASNYWAPHQSVSQLSNSKTGYFGCHKQRNLRNDGLFRALTLAYFIYHQNSYILYFYFEDLFNIKPILEHILKNSSKYRPKELFWFLDEINYCQMLVTLWNKYRSFSWKFNLIKYKYSRMIARDINDNRLSGF